MASFGVLLTFPLAVLTVCEGAQDQFATACGDVENLSVNLTCIPGQWLHVKSEQYSSVDNATQKCAVGIDCPGSKGSSGTKLGVTCNGPVSASTGGVCVEDVQASEVVTDCGSRSAAVSVRYECLSAADMVDLCSNITITMPRLFVGFDIYAYLLTPQFPHTPALSRECSCQVTGENLRMWALEVQLDFPTFLPDPDMLKVVSENKERFRAQRTCPTCHHFEYINEALHFPSETETSRNITVEFQDYNQQGQLAWIEVQSSGPNLSITCQAVDVSPPTTTTSTTSTTTTTTTTTTPPSPIPTTPASRTTSGEMSGRQSTEKGSMTDSSQHGQAQGTESSAVRSAKDSAKEKSGDDSALMVGLSVLAVVLVAVGIIMGILIWRRYQLANKDEEFQTAGGSTGFRSRGVMFSPQYWYNRYRNRHQGGDSTLVPPFHEDIPVHDFHNLEGGHENVDVYDYAGMDAADKNGVRDRRHRTGHGKAHEHSGQKKTEHRTNDGSGDGGVTSYDRAANLDTGYVNYGDRERIHNTDTTNRDLPKDKRHDAEASKNQGEKSPSSEADSSEGKNGEKSSIADIDPKKSKKRKFVTDVLNETLESIINQREALAKTPDVEDQEKKLHSLEKSPSHSTSFPDKSNKMDLASASKNGSNSLLPQKDGERQSSNKDKDSPSRTQDKRESVFRSLDKEASASASSKYGNNSKDRVSSSSSISKGSSPPLNAQHSDAFAEKEAAESAV